MCHPVYCTTASLVITLQNACFFLLFSYPSGRSQGWPSQLADPWKRTVPPRYPYHGSVLPSSRALGSSLHVPTGARWVVVPTEKRGHCQRGQISTQAQAALAKEGSFATKRESRNSSREIVWQCSVQTLTFVLTVLSVLPPNDQSVVFELACTH